jgi:hypothetical protein
MDQYPLCRHIKVNGIQCQSPALTGNDFCYFHCEERKRRSVIREASAKRRYEKDGSTLVLDQLDLPSLEDANAIQVTIGALLRALAANQISNKKAGLVLYGLQIATCNIGKTTLSPEKPAAGEPDPRPEFLSEQAARSAER